MTLLDHLEELRTRILWSVFFLFLGLAGGFCLAQQVTQILVRPFSQIEIHREERVLKVRVEPSTGAWRFADPVGPALFKEASPYRLDFYLPGTPLAGKADFTWGQTLQRPVFFNPLDPVTLYFQSAMIVGFILALPFLLYQVWLFVAPGLLAQERRIARILLGFGCILFPLGALFAYYMFPLMLKFLLNFQIGTMEPQLEIFKFVNLELKLMGAFGIVFEMPLVIMFLVFLGVLHPAQLRRYRAHVIVGLAVVSMIATPGSDPISMLLMMGPLVILYEISIWASIPLAKKQQEAAVQ